MAGAGGAAHLPGMLAAKTELPVIGVPIPTQHLGGLDSLLSIVQMPRGIPVATVAIGNAENAALLAASILALGDAALAARLADYRARQTAAVMDDPSNEVPCRRGRCHGMAGPRGAGRCAARPAPSGGRAEWLACAEWRPRRVAGAEWRGPGSGVARTPRGTALTASNACGAS